MLALRSICIACVPNSSGSNLFNNCLNELGRRAILALRFPLPGVRMEGEAPPSSSHQKNFTQYNMYSTDLISQKCWMFSLVCLQLQYTVVVVVCSKKEILRGEVEKRLIRFFLVSYIYMIYDDIIMIL